MTSPDLQTAARALAEGRPEDAVPALQALVRQWPAYAAAHVLLARAHEATGARKDALEAWHNAHFFLPTSPLVVRERERLLIERATAPTPAAPAPTLPAQPAPALSAEAVPAPPPDLDAPESDAPESDAPEPRAAPAPSTAEAEAEPEVELEAEQPDAWVPLFGEQDEELPPLPEDLALEPVEMLEAIPPPPAPEPEAEPEAEEPALPEPPVDEPEAAEPEPVPEPPAPEPVRARVLPPEDPPLPPPPAEDLPADEDDDWKILDEIEEDRAPAAAEPAIAEPVAPPAADAPAPLDDPESEGHVREMAERADDLDALIEQLESAGRIRPDPAFEPSAELEPDDDDDADDMVSETLARIYAAQKAYAQAAEVYDRLAEQQPARADDFRRLAGEMRAAAEHHS